MLAIRSYYLISLEAQRLGVRPEPDAWSETIQKLDSFRLMLLSSGHIHEALWFTDIIDERCQISEYMIQLHRRQGKLQDDFYANLLDIAGHFDSSEDEVLLQSIDQQVFTPNSSKKFQDAFKLTQQYMETMRKFRNASTMSPAGVEDLSSTLKRHLDASRYLRIQLKSMKLNPDSADDMRDELIKDATLYGDGDVLELARLEVLGKALVSEGITLYQNPGFVLETCTNFLNKYPYPLYQSLVAQKLMAVYREMKDYQNAIEYAKLLLGSCQTLRDKAGAERAEAELSQLQLILEATSSPPNSLARRRAQSRISAAFSQLLNMPLVASDTQNSLFTAAIQSAIDTTKGFQDPTTIEDYLDSVEKRIESMPEEEQARQRLINACARASLLTAALSPSPLAVIQAWESVLQKMGFLPKSEQDNLQDLFGRCMFNIGGALNVRAYHLFSADVTSKNQEAMETNSKAIQQLGQAIEALSKTTDLLHLGLANIQMALGINLLCMQLRTIDPVPILDYLSEAVSLLQEYRDELWMLSLVDKHRTGEIVESWRATYDACREAVGILAFCQEHDQDSEDDYPLQAWPWAQRSKGASLAELLNDEKNPFLSVNEESLSDPAADLLRQWKRLASSLGSTSSSEQLPELRRRRRLLKQEMRRIAELRPLFPVWRGEVTLEDLDDSVKLSQIVLWVDWILSDGAYFMFTARSARQSESDRAGRISMSRLSLAPQMVERWIRRHCSSESLDTPDAEASLSALQDLVEPLKTLAQPGDLLVFCPTSNLHRVPLHAIRLHDRPIIEEFPIIYSHGLSVFRSNFLRQLHGPKKISQQPCVFGNPTSDRPATETAAREFSSNFEDAHLYLGKAASKSEFNDAAKVGSVLFFSGHTLGSEDPLEDGLLFGDGVLTAKEISESVMDGNPHVGLIACASSRQKYTVGNEPLGLQAAFIVAGASSVLATLWPIDGESGRLFSKHFYGTLMSPEVSSSPTNLATAYQEAVRKMRNNPETITLYHWAPFVLYGSWFSEKLITR